MNDFVQSGHGEWEDPELRTRCRILWRKPEQLASDIYDWAVANGYINSVCTVYELHSGEGMYLQSVLMWRIQVHAKLANQTIIHWILSLFLSDFSIAVSKQQMSMVCHSRELMKSCYDVQLVY